MQIAFMELEIFSDWRLLRSTPEVLHTFAGIVKGMMEKIKQLTTANL